MKLSRRGHALMGAGGEQGSLDGQAFPFASYGGGAWVDDETVIVALAPSGDVALWKPWSGQPPSPIEPRRPANQLAGGGGVWLAFAATQPESLTYSNAVLDRSGGPRTALPRGGAGDVAPDGTIAFVPDYQAGAGLRVVDAGGAIVDVPGVVASELQALPGGQAIWRGGAHGRNPVRPFYRNAQNLKLVTIDGVDHLIYWSEGVGLVLQIDGSSYGFVLERRSSAFNHDAVDAGYLTIAWSQTSGEGPGDLVQLRVVGGEIVFDIDPDGPAREVPTYSPLSTPAPSVPRIGRPLWCGWFVFGAPPPDLPGNCLLPVDEHMQVIDRHGRPVAQYVAGASDSDVDDLDAAIAEARRTRLDPFVPILAYWTGTAQRGRLPNGADIVGVEAYRLLEESLAAFEARVATALMRCRRAFLIAQGYTSNGRQTTDLVSLVPVYARLARAHAQVEGILVFSAGTRPTGWADHPEVHDAWRALADGIPGAPALPTPPMPRPPGGVPAPPGPVPPHRPGPPPAPSAPPKEQSMKNKDQVRADINELIRFYNEPDGLNRRARGLPTPVEFHDPAITDWFTLAVLEPIEQIKARIRTYPEYKAQHDGAPEPP